MDINPSELTSFLRYFDDDSTQVFLLYYTEVSVEMSFDFNAKFQLTFSVQNSVQRVADATSGVAWSVGVCIVCPHGKNCGDEVQGSSGT